jgi:phage head maturation protease
VAIFRSRKTGHEEMYALLHLADTEVGQWAAEEIARGKLARASVSFLPIRVTKSEGYRIYTEAALLEISIGSSGAHPRAFLVDTEHGMPRVSRKFFTGGR